MWGCRQAASWLPPSNGAIVVYPGGELGKLEVACETGLLLLWKNQLGAGKHKTKVLGQGSFFHF